MRHYVTDASYVEGAMGPGWNDGEPRIIDKGSNRFIVVDRSRHARSFTKSGSNFTADHFYKEALVQSADTNYLYLFDQDGNVTTYYNTTFASPVQLAGRLVSSYNSFFRDGATNYTLTAAGYNTYSPPNFTAQLTARTQQEYVGGSPDNTNYVNWGYQYYGTGLFPAQLQYVYLRRQVNSVLTVVRYAEYLYYQSSGPNGPAGALQRVIIRDPSGNPIETKYYRYDAMDGNGRVPLRFVVEGPSYERLKVAAGGTDALVDSASDATVVLYSNYKFVYDANVAVTSETVQGKGAITFTRTYTGFADGVNNWKCKTTEQYPDASVRIVYTNYLAQEVLRSDGVGALTQITYKQRDSAGRITLEATPSAVSSYNLAEPADLGVVLNTGAGLIKLTNYAATTTATTSTPGNVAGYVTSRQVSQGTVGPPDTTESYTYIQHDGTVFSGTRSVFALASRTVYAGTAGTSPRTTKFSYTWKTPAGAAGPSNRIDSVTTAFPIVSTGNNGNGGTVGVDETKTVQYFDNWGRPTWFKDEDNFIHYTQYDRLTGAATRRIVDVNTAITGDFTGLPTGWSTPAGGGLHLKTDYECDLLSRTTRISDPSGNLTYTIFKDSNWESRVYPGWTGTTTTGPTRVERRDKLSNYSEQFEMTAAPNVVGGRPDGSEAVSGVVSMKRDFYDDVQRLDHRDSYYNLTGLTYVTGTGYGALATNFFRETHGYDVNGRPDRYVDPTGTITRTVYDVSPITRVTSKWTGTDDTPTSGTWSPSNLTGTNTTKTTTYEYDNNVSGNNTVTKITRNGSLASGYDFLSKYDYRDRLTDSLNLVQSIAIRKTLDNMGRTTIEETWFSPDFTYTPSELRAKKEAKFDEKGQVYQKIVHSVVSETDPASGAAGTILSHLTTNYWSNARGMTVKVKGPNGEFQKTQYDGAGRVKASYTCYDDTEANTDYASALTVNQQSIPPTAADTVISQSVPSYDADSNVIQTTRYQRTDSTTKTGELSAIWAESDSRRTYTASWFDAVNRTTSLVDYGRNGGATLSRPGTPPAPNTSDAYIVTMYEYDAAGQQWKVTDNKAQIMRMYFDALGRVVKKVENWQESTFNDVSPTASELDTNRTTDFVYDGSARLSQLKAYNPKGGMVEVQTTKYVYGTTSNIFRNDLLVAVIYPDSDDSDNPLGNGADTVYDRLELTYDYLGRLITRKLPDGTIHTYTYDNNTLIWDQATALGSGVDGAIRRLQYSYDNLGRPLLVGSYTAVSGGTLRNQLKYTYDGWGNVKKVDQGHEAAVAGAPFFQKTFADGAVSGEAKYVRLTQLTYPNGRTVYRNYPGSGVGDKLSRVDNIAHDASGTLKFAQMTYLGLGSVVKIAHPGVTGGLNLDFGTGNGNPGGWDDFGRIKDQKWQNDSLVIKDQYQYGYDRTSNRTFRDNLTATGKDNYYAYNGLDQVTTAKQGDLNAGRTDITGTPSLQEAWTLESLGNWRQLVQTTSGTTTLDQTRAHTAANEVTTIAATTGTDWGDGVVDQNGFMTRVSKPSTPNERWQLTRDAWGRLVKVVNEVGGATVAEYKYDGRHHRIVKLRPNGANWDRRDYYYSCEWQVVEERERLNVASKTTVATVPKYQWVWGTRYIDEIVLRDENKDGDADCIDGADQRLYYAQDANWNVTSLIDTAGTVVERVLYDSYGRHTLFNAAWSATQASTLYANEELFTGYRLNPESGLYQIRNREYHPTLGRWIQRDPMGYHDGMNLYEYAASGPIDSFDPSGLQHVELPTKYSKHLNPIQNPYSLKPEEIYGYTDAFFIIDAVCTKCDNNCYRSTQPTFIVTTEIHIATWTYRSWFFGLGGMDKDKEIQRTDKAVKQTLRHEQQHVAAFKAWDKMNEKAAMSELNTSCKFNTEKACKDHIKKVVDKYQASFNNMRALEAGHKTPQWDPNSEKYGGLPALQWPEWDEDQQNTVNIGGAIIRVLINSTGPVYPPVLPK